MSLDLVNTVSSFLQKRPNQKFIAREIAEWIFENYPKECQEKRKRSTAKISPIDSDAALIQQIVAEIGARRPRLQARNPLIKTIETRPRKYYFTEHTDRVEVEEAEKEESGKPKEHDLYPKLTEFLLSGPAVYSKRIDEKCSINSGGKGANKWLHPDLVGMENLGVDWHGDIKECVKEYGDIKTRLWSFEVKLFLNRSNVRECFFQAVSNSSWANVGYLVALDVEGIETTKELQILSSLHGIGFIQLSFDNPSESEIKIPAKERPDVDWNVMNRLAGENKHFLSYVKALSRFYQTKGYVDPSSWDGF